VADSRTRTGLQHTRACSNGNGAFLLLSNSIVLLLTGTNRGCMWGSCYIDAHGEEDIGLRRGRPLFLDAARVELVRRAVVQANIPSICQSAMQQLVSGRRWTEL